LRLSDRVAWRSLGKSFEDICNDVLREAFEAETTGPRLVGIVRASMFNKQVALLDDANPRRCACCSRRAGKTQGIIRALFARCLERAKSVAVYFAPTLAQARKLVWDGPEGIPATIRELGLAPYSDLNETDHRVTFKNGSVLWVSGCETMPDEGQDWPEDILAYLVNEVIAPALMDRRGELLITGTPGPYHGGLFFEIATGIKPGWSRYGWTCFENPHLRDPKAYVAADMAARGLSPDDPIAQREYWGRWVRDSTALLYRYTPGFNDFAEAPYGKEWRYVLGMDLGVRDLSTFILCGFREYDPCVYVLDVHGEPDADATRVAEIIRGFRVKYGAATRLVMDTGALGLMLANELRHRHSLVIEAAKKTEKAAAIRMMNDQLRLGNVKVGPGCHALTDQWNKLQIDPKTQIEKPAMACDYADGALYAWRDCWAYLAKPAPDNSPAAQQAAMIARIMEQRTQASLPLGSRAREQREMAFQGYEGD
jgi:hypothetical protein